MNKQFEKIQNDTHLDTLESKGFPIRPMVGALIHKRVNQPGQKPNSRSMAGIVSIPSG
jgi:hypothetical protein